MDKMNFVLVLVFWIPKLLQVYSYTSWGANCPIECECESLNTAQTQLFHLQPSNSSVKTALCIFTNRTLPAIFYLPFEIESITILQANDNKDMILSGTHLHDFKNIKSIDLQGSLKEGAMIHIRNDAFHGLLNLKFLSLQRVSITGAEKAFSKLSHLEVLYVIHCDIGYLKWEMLDGLKNLRELYLQESGIKELYGFAFYGTPELRRLFLSHNDLFSVEADAFVGLLKLEYLDLSNNRIEHLSGLTFPPLPHLQYLELKHNPIKVIFPHCFQFLNGTQHLTLGHEKQPVHLMKFSFRGLYSLLFLHIPNIDNDALFEHMFYDLKSLLHLNLKGRIKIINNRAFNGAHKLLEKLILKDCKIEKVYPDSFYGLEKLQVLDLSENLLTSLPEGAFEYMKSVQNILLNGNHLRQIPDDLFFAMPTLRGVSLHDNPWNCTCEMQYWKEEQMLSRYVPVEEKTCNETACSVGVDFDDETDLMPRCEVPRKFKDQSVFDALKSFKCDGL